MDLSFEALAGRSYQPKGYVEGNSYVVWIEETGTGKNVSGKAKQPLRPVRQSAPTIFVPPVLLQ